MPELSTLATLLIHCGGGEPRATNMSSHTSSFRRRILRAHAFISIQSNTLCKEFVFWHPQNQRLRGTPLKKSSVTTLIGCGGVSRFFNIVILRLPDHKGGNSEMKRLEVLLLTGRTLKQGQGKEHGKLSEKYQESVSICEMDPDDIKRIGVKESQPIKVTTDHGSVVLRVVKSLRAPHAGKVFVPYGPWASIIANSKTHGTGMPSLKGIEATVEPAADREKVLTLSELIQQNYAK